MSNQNNELVRFFNESPDLLCVAGMDGYFKRLNPAWTETLGYSLEELLAEPYISFVHPDDLPNTLAEAGKLSTGVATVWFENRYRCKDGSYRWLMWRASPNVDRNQIIASARDVSQRKAIEQQLIEMTMLQKAILDGANFSIISTSTDGLIRTFNAAAERDLGYTREEVVDKVTPAIIHDPKEVIARAEALSAELGYTVEPGFEAFVAKARLGQADENEWTYVRKDGTRYTVLLSVTALFNDRGEVTGYMGVGHDITARKAVEQALKQSNQDLEQFAYVASHDLHEPLRVVTSYLQLLERRAAPALDADALSFLHTAVEGSRRMHLLIQDLLSYSRVGTRGHPLRPTSLEEVLMVALNNLEIAIEVSHAEIAHGPLPMVIGDSIQLVQVFQNLIGNAIKFSSDAAPRIEVAAEREGPEWIIRVTDNGIGINAKAFDRIFLIFQRLHTREEYDGTGIGLAVCKRIMDRHHGRIWVQSAEGNGSSFFFTLPAANGLEPRP